MHEVAVCGESLWGVDFNISMIAGHLPMACQASPAPTKARIKGLGLSSMATVSQSLIIQ